ncbi:MAG: tetratricopeptide repeat protein [Promethearchaeota archaeon]
MNYPLTDNIIRKIESLFVHPHTSLILNFLIGKTDDLMSAMDILKNELDETKKGKLKKRDKITSEIVSRAIFNLLSEPEKISRGRAEEDLTALLQAFSTLSAPVDYQIGVELVSLNQIHQLEKKEERLFWLTSRMGFTLLKNDNVEPAANLLKLGIQIGKETNIDSKKLAEILNNFAIAARKQANISEAEEAYKEAIEIRQPLAATDPNEKNRLARLLNNLAALYSDVERFEEAEQVLSQALSLRRELMQTNSFYTAFYLQTLENMLALLYQKGDMEKASAYEKEITELKNEIQQNLEKEK